MAKYIAQSDIEDVFGVDNVALWSNLDNSDDMADTVRIAKAIEYAEEDIENRFRESRYAVPFVGTTGNIPKVLIDWMAKIAGLWLFECRPKVVDEEEISFDDMKKSIDSEIAAYHSGQRRLALTLAETNIPGAPIVM